MKFNRYTLSLVIFWIIFSFVISYFVYANTTAVFKATRSLILYSNLLQRISAVLGLTILLTQIVIGAFLVRIKKRFGKEVLNIHATQGIILYALILTHTFSLFIFNFFGKGVPDPFYVYSDFCIICQNKTELFISLGRFSFWIVSFTVLAAFLRKHISWKDNWIYFHRINYVLFILVAIHAWFIGSDISKRNLIYLFYFLIAVFVITASFKIIEFLRNNFKLR